MKQIVTLVSLVAFLFTSFQAIPQGVPQGISYQAVARDLVGDELVNVTLGVRIGILSGSVDGILQWEETHSVQTNEFGLFMLVIGQGFNTLNGTATSFSEIPWSSDAHFLKVELDVPGIGGYELMGISQLLSVPYALHAGSADMVDEVDGDVTNELVDSFYLEGTELIIEESGNIHTVDFNNGPFDLDPGNELIEEIDYDSAMHQLTVTEAGNSWPLDVTPLEDGNWHVSPDDSAVYNLTQRVGIGTPLPNSTMHVQGSYAASVTNLVGPVIAFPATEDHQVFICDVTAASVEINLPQANSCSGRMYSFKRYDTVDYASNPLKITAAAGDFIEMDISFTMDWIENEAAVIISDGNDWWIMSYHRTEL